MADFDSIINVEEWISDYFLTSDEGETFGKRVAAKVTAWKNDAKVTENGGGGVAYEHPLAKLTGKNAQLQTAFSTLDTNNPQHLEELYSLVEDVFDYHQPTSLSLTRAGEELDLVAAADAAGSFIVLRAHAVEVLEDLTTETLLHPVELNGKPTQWSITKSVGELFLTDTPPQFIVVLSGNWAIIAERESWPLGRYLAINLSLAVDRKDTKAKGELQRVAVALARENLERAADGTTWWLSTIEASRNHSVKVSAELREAIKRSIEIIGNEVLDRHRAQGLGIEHIDGNLLAKQSLRYLYRILFLLFAEASPELEILPTGDNDYDEGYGLTRLRDLILTEPDNEAKARSTHIYQSLQILFRLIDTGHDPLAQESMPDAAEDGLTFRALSADLFQPQATEYIDRVQLSNAAMVKVLQNLLLSAERKGADRGFISYATLGVTELGQVYEGLMSYTGFIAQEDLYEVAPHGNPEKGSWVISQAKVQADPNIVPPDSFVKVRHDDESTGGFEDRNRGFKKGSFVYRQSSRDRQRSASFYTPPVITEFTVGQGVEELQAAGRITKADDILNLKVLEPAMGSGAFAVEAVNQLAELYLTMKQAELGEEIPAENRAYELQKVKAHIALHQVYGVDLNSTAVELAEISLWLSTMTRDLASPWFGLHLRHGNSLIGASRSTFAATELKKKGYLVDTPKHHGAEGIAHQVDSGATNTELVTRIHHFLVPSNGWGASADAKILKDLDPEAIKQLKNWRTSIRKSLNATQIKQLQLVANRVERLWQIALVRARIAEDQARRDIDVFGQAHTKTAKNVRRKDIERDFLHNLDGAYLRLRWAMNLWNAMWFWPITEAENAPDIEEWIQTIKDILGVEAQAKNNNGTSRIGFDLRWDEITTIEEFDAQVAGQKSKDRIYDAHPWVRIADEISAEQAFFHWDLDFVDAMSQGGFDLQVGNPPWVRPDVVLNDLLSEHDPWFNLASKPTQAAQKERRESLLQNSEVLNKVAKGSTESVVLAAVLRDQTRYPFLKDQRPDLYRAFMNKTWSQMGANGIVALVHPESHFTEKAANSLRDGAYRRLRRHWQFVNELRLFDVHNLVTFGVHIYGSDEAEPSFQMASSLYHPRTVIESFMHDGTGPIPGFKDENYGWDLRPHADRITLVNSETLGVWKSVLEDENTPLLHARMVYSVNSTAAAIMAKLSVAQRASALSLQYSSGWNETTDKKAGYFDSSWQVPDSWDEVILQGPHLGVATPMIKQPNPTMKSNKDWAEIDLEGMPADFIPATAYKPEINSVPYFEDFPKVTFGDRVSAGKFYRVAWREMAALTGYRTCYPSLIPKGTAHVMTIMSAASEKNEDMVIVGASLSSMLVDFYIRSGGSGHINIGIVEKLPIAGEEFRNSLIRRYLELNCLTEAYAPLWEELLGEKWTSQSPLRNAKQRFHAQNEIDAMVALSLGISLDELLDVYRTQFPVMRKYDGTGLYDANGRKVPKEIVKLHEKEGELSVEQRTWTHPQSQIEYVFEYPFAPLDREADLRAAYEKYEKVV